MSHAIRAIIFDIYGTLLAAPPGRVRHDPSGDMKLRAVLRMAGQHYRGSPSAGLARLVDRHHASSTEAFPEIDLRVLWRELLELPADAPMDDLVAATEAVWHPAVWMPGAPEMLHRLHRAGLVMGLLSNAQCNALRSLHPCQHLFSGDLTVLSYQHLIAKPAPELFRLMADRLHDRRIAPQEVLFVGNDPLLDISPAAAAGFRTALFAGHPSAARPGDCAPDLVLKHWDRFTRF